MSRHKWNGSPSCAAPAFFAIAFVECKRDEGRVQSLDPLYLPDFGMNYENNSSPLIPLRWEYWKLGS
ncbi:hypothetical protein L484_005878 [Morus notabilis]|uniref:Uncharacterized protein n=1 Tax=Morus notabilis TaxID=981085 RepID=W9RMD3_9ROSA|nr:hypothetical protein L484_005878 [Morus notabilis]